MSDNRKYLIWSNEHRAWWAPGGLGYTTLTHAAGRYSKEAAEDICKKANVVPGTIEEVMVVAPFQIVADDQFIRAAKASIVKVEVP